MTFGRLLGPLIKDFVGNLAEAHDIGVDHSSFGSALPGSPSTVQAALETLSLLQTSAPPGQNYRIVYVLKARPRNANRTWPVPELTQADVDAATQFSPLNAAVLQGLPWNRDAVTANDEYFGVPVSAPDIVRVRSGRESSQLGGYGIIYSENQIRQRLDDRLDYEGVSYKWVRCASTTAVQAVGRIYTLDLSGLPIQPLAEAVP